MSKEDINITDSELEILSVLWDKGPTTVKQVHEAIGASRDTGYTTVLKQMQVMHEKGLLNRDDGQRQHIYSPVPSRKKVQRRFTRQFVQSVFGGSPAELVLHALSNYKTSPEELEEIKSLIEQVKSKNLKK